MIFCSFKAKDLEPLQHYLHMSVTVHDLCRHKHDGQLQSSSRRIRRAVLQLPVEWSLLHGHLLHSLQEGGHLESKGFTLVIPAFHWSEWMENTCDWCLDCLIMAQHILIENWVIIAVDSYHMTDVPAFPHPYVHLGHVADSYQEWRTCEFIVKLLSRDYLPPRDKYYL